MSTPFDTHARAINAPALELIADILEKHTNGVLAGAREHIEQRKSRRKADEALLRQALEALELSPCSSKYEQDCHVCNTITALRTRLSTGDNLSPTANLTKTS